MLKHCTIRIILWTLVGILTVLVLLVTGGYLYLRNSEWWPAITMFNDDVRVDNFRSMDTILPALPIRAGDDVWEFERDPQSLPQYYEFAGERHALEDFLESTETTGLLVARDGVILHESYRLGYDETSPAASWSVAKSFLSALVGIALDEGYIDSIDTPIDHYAPLLAQSGYASVPIRHVLTMSSGVAFNENYDGFFSDINMLFTRAFAFEQPVVEQILELERVREPGTYNDYISVDSIALGMLLEAATGMSVSAYLESRLWQPIGMEADGFWNTDRSGQELAFCCLNATLRDYARFGRLYLNDGARNDVQLVPRNWVHASVTPEAPHLQPGENPASFWTFGYGYQWWVPEEPQGDFLAIGIWGQYIYVHPAHDLIIVKTSADYYFDENDHETVAMFRSIVEALSEL